MEKAGNIGASGGIAVTLKVDDDTVLSKDIDSNNESVPGG